MGATLVAITPQLTEHHQGLIDRHRLSFDLLSDPGNEYAARLGIRYTLPEYLQAICNNFGLILPTHNGEDSWTLPMPARYVVDQEGIIRAADVHADYTRRPEPQKTLDDLRELGS